MTWSKNNLSIYRIVEKKVKIVCRIVKQMREIVFSIEKLSTKNDSIDSQTLTKIVVAKLLTIDERRFWKRTKANDERQLTRWCNEIVKKLMLRRLLLINRSIDLLWLWCESTKIQLHAVIMLMSVKRINFLTRNYQKLNTARQIDWSNRREQIIVRAIYCRR